MILVDTSIWIDHLHRVDPALNLLLDDLAVCVHSMVIGELALGSLRDRSTVLQLLSDLPPIVEADHDEVLRLVETNGLYGVGLSVVDAHLLASARLNPDVKLWTRDRRLLAAAERLGVARSS